MSLEKTIHSQENILLSSRSRFCLSSSLTPQYMFVYHTYIYFKLLHFHFLSSLTAQHIYVCAEKGYVPTNLTFHHPWWRWGGGSDGLHASDTWKYTRIWLTQRAWPSVLFGILAFNHLSLCVCVIRLPCLLNHISKHGTFRRSLYCSSQHSGANTAGFGSRSWCQ